MQWKKKHFSKLWGETFTVKAKRWNNLVKTKRNQEWIAWNKVWRSSDWLVVILELAQDGESIDVLSLSSQDCSEQFIRPEKPSIFWVLEIVGLDVLPDELNNFTPGNSDTANDSGKLGISLKQSSCVSMSCVHSSPSMNPFPLESSHSGHPVLGLDMVVPVVPPSTSVWPPSCQKLIILHHVNYLLPLTFSLQRFPAVWQNTRGFYRFNFLSSFDAKNIFKCWKF